jgi:predicted nucleic acid-binding protein
LNYNKINFLKNIEILNLTTKNITEYAQISANLSKKSEIIGYFDELIRSMTIARNDPLITRNVRHYNRIPNLSLLNWEEM